MRDDQDDGHMESADFSTISQPAVIDVGMLSVAFELYSHPEPGASRCPTGVNVQPQPEPGFNININYLQRSCVHLKTRRAKSVQHEVHHFWPRYLPEPKIRRAKVPFSSSSRNLPKRRICACEREREGYTARAVSCFVGGKHGTGMLGARAVREKEDFG